MPTHSLAHTHTGHSSSPPATRYVRLDRPKGTALQSLRETQCCAPFFAPWSLTHTPALNIQIAMLIAPVPRSVSVGRITGNAEQARARLRYSSPPPQPTPTLTPSPAPQPQPSAEPHSLLPTLTGAAA